MSAAAYYGTYRREPYRIPAGILAMAVHGVFFSLLYFGFSWQIKPPGPISVELWQSLPEPVEVPSEKPKVEEVVPPPPQPLPPPQPVQIAEPEIVLPVKKKPEPRRVETKQAKKKTATGSADKKQDEQKQTDIDRELLLEQQQAERERAEVAAAREREVKGYIDKIQRKITINVVMPPGVPGDALAIFNVTLLPGGGVLSAVMKKSSGNAAYDNAVERAIYKSDPLPLPPDAKLFKDFRNLTLKFQPGK